MHPNCYDLTPGLNRPSVSIALVNAYAARSRTVLRKRMGGDWPSAGRIGLNAPGPVKASLVAAGASCDENGRVSVSRSLVVTDEWQTYAPLVARRNFVPLHVDMIPASSFGASLSNLLTPQNWREIRKHSHRAAGYVCEICGENDGPIECHEVWRFDDVKTVDGKGVQTLLRMLSLCTCCHEMFHPGLAAIRGRAGAVASRIKAVNCWTNREHDVVVRYMNTVHAARSRKSWCLDLSLVAHLGPLQVSEKWEKAGKAGNLSVETQKGRNFTRIIGVDFLHKGITQQAF